MDQQPRGHSKICSSMLNGRTVSEDLSDVPKVVIDDPEDSSGFASSVVKVLSMQRFYTKSVRRSRESWLQKYAYHRANEEREWRRPLMRKSPSPSPQPESPSADQNVSALLHDEEHDSNENTAVYPTECCMPFVLEPSGKLYFCWLVVVSLGVMYNYYAIILYVAFSSLYTQNIKVCFGIDYAFDSIFLLDILMQFRTGFLQHGILERRSKKLAINYITSRGFLFDILAIIPFDLLYFIVGLYPIFRVNRLLKVRRFFLFCDRGEIYSGRPKLFNLLKLILYLLLIIHWVACLYFILSRFEGFGKDDWIHPSLEGKFAEVGMQYLYSLHRSSVIMTTVGTITVPRTNLTMIFGCVTYLCGVLIFATIVGNAGDMIVDMRRHREHYLRKLNGMKEYVSAHQIPAQLTNRAIQWFDYMWTHKRDMDEDQLFANLNDNFRAEIAIHVNLETLIKVEMFKVCDPGFLHDLVLKLRPIICSPGDFICREGEKGREMYIVNKGCVEVLDERETILATLKAGSHFGEISLLNMKGIGDRRTASVRSVGFTDLFRLSKDDLEEVLEFYPDEKSHMERIATKTFERQQRERQLAKKRDEQNAGDGEVPRDPREWLAADTKLLRRRLSWISGVNNLRKFASRVKKNESPDDNSSKKILKEFSDKARKERSDEECRRIIQEFVAGIHARDSKAHKPSIESEDSFFMRSTSPEWMIPKNRKKTKRSSYCLPEETSTIPESVRTIFRPRSNTMGPLSSPRDLLNFQTLETLPTKPAMNYGPLEVKIKPILKKTSAFGEVKKELIVKEDDENTKPKSFVVINEPLVSIHFKDIARMTMEKRRKWFEGEASDENSSNTTETDEPCLDKEPRETQITDNKTEITDNEIVTCSCVVENPNSSKDALSSTSSDVPVWERQENVNHVKRRCKDKDKIQPSEGTVLQNYNCREARLESEEEPAIKDGFSDEAQVFVNRRKDKSSTNTESTQLQNVKSVHVEVECTCSCDYRDNNNQVKKNPVDQNTKTTAKRTEPKNAIEETPC